MVERASQSSFGPHLEELNQAGGSESDISVERLAEGSSPELIQGGMGVGVSGWELARAVAVAGEELDRNVLGVVSETGLPAIMLERLGENDSNTIRALNSFDEICPGIVQELYDEYLPKSEEGNNLHKIPPKPEVLVNGSEGIQTKLNSIIVAAAFVEVWLAKEGHDGPIGINLLEKIQLMHLPTILGAMMAEVDTVLVGAGIPGQIEKVLQNFADGEKASYRVDIKESSEKHELSLDPEEFGVQKSKLKQPKFYVIASHHIIPQAMILKGGIKIDGVVLEHSEPAGGHGAPARNKKVKDDGQPDYGDLDKPNLEKTIKLNVPCWVAGGELRNFKKARMLGANGIQVGSAFALCEESGLRGEVRELLKERIRAGTLEVKTSIVASPTGYPFQVVQEDGTLSDDKVYRDRKRVCTYGQLVEAAEVIGQDGRAEMVFRCPAEPVEAFVRKGGKREDTEGRMCLCSGLGLAAGYGSDGGAMVITLGKDLESLRELLKEKESPDGKIYAKDVVEFVFSDT